MSISVALLGLALLAWPSRAVARRLRSVVAVTPARRRLPVPRPGTVGVAGGLGLAGWLLLGPGGAVGFVLAGVTGWRRWLARRELRDTLAAVEGMAEALRSLVAELLAGAHPAEAAESAAADAQPQAALAMRAVSATVRLGGDVGSALARSREEVPALADALDQLGRAWGLAARFGLPLADVLDAVRRDLDQRVRFTRQVLARMAGPRASATVLALLPAIGLLLGEAMGARPVHLLGTTPGGQVLLVLGIALVCAGLAWSARLTGRVVLR